MNVMPSIPRVLTALAEWGACLLYVCKYQRRLSGWRLPLVLAAALAVQCVFLQATGSWPVALWIPCMAAAVGLMFLIIWLCGEMTAAGAGYCTVRAFLLAEFAASLAWQLYAFLAGGRPWAGPAAYLPFTALIYGVVFLTMYRLEPAPPEGRRRLSIRPKELWPALLIGLACFVMSNLSFVYSSTPFSGSYLSEIYNIRTLMDLSGVVMLYAYHVQREDLQTRLELDAVQNILQNQYVQYQQSRESIDLINRKYHDLKHQIAVLRAEPDARKRADFLDEMENEIRSYEAQNKTGNSVLDTVLTGKSLTCSKHGIGLTCVADGGLLAFMSTVDISSVFGNILDNAIECELKILEKEKRLIHLEVFSQKGFLMICCENYCPEPVSFQEGDPVTTKEDKDYHGYGIKSLRFTVQKYGGSMTMTMREQWFVLNILIPLPQQ